MATKNGWKTIFDTLLMTYGPKLFVKIALSYTASEINVFLHLTQNFKMAAKNGRKNEFWQKVAHHYIYTLGNQNFRRDLSILYHSRDKCIFAFDTEFQDGLLNMARIRFLVKVAEDSCVYHWGVKNLL